MTNQPIIMPDRVSSIMSAPSKIDELSLEELKEVINTAHQEFESAKEVANRAFNAGLNHAIKAGQHLLAAKKKEGHGKWSQWVSENCSFTIKTAQLYMRVANKSSILAENGLASGTSLRVALKLLRETSTEETLSAKVEDTSLATKTETPEVRRVRDLELKPRNTAGGGWQLYKPGDGEKSKLLASFTSELEENIILEIAEFISSKIGAD